MIENGYSVCPNNWPAEQTFNLNELHKLPEGSQLRLIFHRLSGMLSFRRQEIYTLKQNQKMDLLRDDCESWDRLQLTLKTSLIY